MSTRRPPASPSTRGPRKGIPAAAPDRTGEYTESATPADTRRTLTDPRIASLPDGAVAASTVIGVGGTKWLRLMVRTHVIRPGENIAAVVERYVRPLVQPGDWVFVGQKAVSIAQGRLVREADVRPGRLAKVLARHVRRTPFGRGLGRPATMQVALQEGGASRLLLASVVHLAARALGRSGAFYRIAGQRIATIDGVTDWALPPYNRCIVLYPNDPDRTAARIAGRSGVPAAIVDLNDLGGEVLGASDGIDRPLLVRIVADNPMGQGAFRTPIGIARRLQE